MKTPYAIIDKNNFEISDDLNFSVEKDLSFAISELNKKGYYTEMVQEAKIFGIFKIASLVEELKKLNLITINDDTRKIIEKESNSATLIIFKEKYNFKTLPECFEIVETDNSTHLYYHLDILTKDTTRVEFKELLDLYNELESSIINLNEWVMSLEKMQ